MYATHRDGRNEFEVFSLAVALMVGVAQAFFAESPQSVSTTTGPMFELIWAWTLLIAPIVALVGIFWPDSYTGLILEMTGLLAVSGVMLSYAAIVMVTSASAPSLVSVPMTVAFGVAALRRCYRIGKKTFSAGQRQKSLLREEVQRSLEQRTDLEIDKRELENGEGSS